MYFGEGVLRHTIEGLDRCPILSEKAAWLEKPFDEDEVRRVAQELAADKALGPDDLPWPSITVVGTSLKAM